MFAVRCRLKERENYVRKKELYKSDIAKHSWSSNHQLNFSEAKVIIKCNSNFDLDFYEAYNIHKYTIFLVDDLTCTPFFLLCAEILCSGAYFQWFTVRYVTSFSYWNSCFCRFGQSVASTWCYSQGSFLNPLLFIYLFHIEERDRVILETVIYVLM